MARVHPSAVVEDGAVLADDVVVGPFCMVGPQVKIGAGSLLHSHVAVAGDTQIGEGAKIFPFASIGHQPQDLKYAGEANRLVIGRNAMIREGVTLNPGTAGGGGTTEIGDDCALLANAHVAHDCRIGNHVILVNGAMVAGHCVVGDYAILGGGVGVHQWVRIGPHSFVGGMSALDDDLIPYGLAIGNRAYLGGLNLVGLRRRGFAREEIHALRRAYRILFTKEGALKDRVEAVATEFAGVALVQEVTAFIRTGGDRALCAPRGDVADEP